MPIEAIVLNREDNVATAVRRLESGEMAGFDSDASVTITRDIPFGHKFALHDIESGGNIIKFGEIIGQATVKIKQGEHVHVHNVEGIRGRGDRQ